ncbi:MULTISPECIES: biopolymer transporter ExbD [unclassified Oleiphilus]|uniref:ExbD/TolR family protein n=2 Tax=Oleiphilus TaxID=141450 RepID=UPI0007C3D9CE|nr:MULTISPECIES: biopolymer transporter ExbD [unclassified Oleiphilus]KZY93040.1 biopolymer transporter ExbD [Oleiphilus sp. HI0072]KZZ10604.1 biopolymer transporter ExbD [Oleiphilus sp. HI0078]KZZ23741.1 biopolymer transporter ExbD [Oleiphilus sp. HI0081]KZY28508.1 biopolymer transporter ExbD [Oleiphilus sp. HI0043]KZY62833.1 biopolymer transporter ExbD [Oleiphilus sp. HI0061]
MKRKHRRLRSEADLDITAFMNLMIVLVPILLINMIFAHTSVLELNFPTQDQSSAQDDESLQLQVMILEDKLVVADNKGGVIKQIDSLKRNSVANNSSDNAAVSTGAYDFAMLGQVMQELKSRIPEKKDITVMARKDTSYQTLVSVMDKVRSYRTVVAGSVVNAELFPEVSIADAPEVVDANESVADAKTELTDGKVRS